MRSGRRPQRARIIPTLEPSLPLPEGEGRGEGEGGVAGTPRDRRRSNGSEPFVVSSRLLCRTSLTVGQRALPHSCCTTTRHSLLPAFALGTWVPAPKPDMPLGRTRNVLATARGVSARCRPA